MADFTIPITVPDAAVNKLVAAMRWNYGQIRDGETMRDMTPAELRAKLKGGVVDGLKDMYRRHQAYLSEQAAQPPALPDIA